MKIIELKNEAIIETDMDIEELKEKSIGFIAYIADLDAAIYYADENAS